MILYHGSNIDIKNIDLLLCHPYKDFGSGFYLTEIEEQAMRMAERTARIYGGEPVLNKYEFDASLYETMINNNELKVKTFDKPDKEWAQFVMDNRDKDKEHPIHDYDVVIGPVANDTMATQFRIFKNGYINLKELTKRIKYRDFSMQLLFGTERSLKLLKKL